MYATILMVGRSIQAEGWRIYLSWKFNTNECVVLTYIYSNHNMNQGQRREYDNHGSNENKWCET